MRRLLAYLMTFWDDLCMAIEIVREPMRDDD